MATPESKVKKAVKEVLKHFDAYQHWPVQTGFGAPTLDCVGCCKGHFFSVETKAPGGKLTPRQQATIEEMRAAGAKVFVVGEYEVTGSQGSLFPKAAVYSGVLEMEEWLRTL